VFGLKYFGIKYSNETAYKSWLKTNRPVLYRVGELTGLWKVLFIFISRLNKQAAVFNMVIEEGSFNRDRLDDVVLEVPVGERFEMTDKKQDQEDSKLTSVGKAMTSAGALIMLLFILVAIIGCLVLFLTMLS